MKASLAPEELEAGSQTPTEITELGVTGENDSLQDKILKASSVATLTWNGSPSGYYLISIFDESGTSEVCPSKQVAGNSISLTGCSLNDYSTYKVRVTPTKSDFQALLTPLNLFEIITKKLRWNFSSLTILPGETVNLSILDGEAAFSLSSSPRLNGTTLAYSIPITAADFPQNEVLTVTDNRGTSTDLNVNILRFFDSPDALAEAPKASLYTQPLEAVIAADGSLVMTHHSESARWQYDYNVLRSTDKGASAKLADYNIPALNKATLSRAITKDPSGNIYSCSGGYKGLDDFAHIRKSTDNGLTWSTIYFSDAGQNEACYDITTNSLGWILYLGVDPDAALGENGVVKLSKNGGTTWETIYKDGGLFFEAAFAPDDTLWIFGATQTAHIVRFIKGSFDGTNWNFSTYANPAGLTNTYYITQWTVWNKAGDFEFVDENQAYFIGANKFDLLKTTNGGTSWSVSASVANGLGRDIMRLNDGTLLMAGGSILASDDMRPVILRKGPLDVGFSEVLRLPDNTYYDQHCGVLIQFPDNDIIALCQRGGWPSPAETYISHDGGLSWSLHGTTGWGQVTDAWINGYFQTFDGELISSITSLHHSGSYSSHISKLNYNSTTWTTLTDIINSKNFPDPHDGNDDALLVGKDMNGIYYSIVDNYIDPLKLFISSDNGASWSQQPAPDRGGTPYSKFMQHLPINKNKFFLIAQTSTGIVDILESTDNGSSFSTRFSFPFGGGSSFTYQDILLAKNGTLYISGNEKVGATDYARVYRSTDDGTTWSLVHSEALSSSNVRIVEGPQGVIYISGSDIYSTTNQGDTWSTLSIPVYVSDFVVLDNGHIVIQSSNETWMKSINEGTWIKTEDIYNFDFLDLSTDGQIYKIGPNTFGIPYFYVDTETGYQARLRTLTLPSN